MTKPQHLVVADMHDKTLLIGVFTPNNHMANPEYYYEEFISLVETLGEPYDEKYFTKLRAIDSNSFFTKGKLEELAKFCEENKIERAIISELLSPLQERNIEDAIGCPVMDREQLILEIFKKSAKTSEGKIQIEMADIEFMKTRIMGRGREYAQQAGFIGNRGPGETLKEELRRCVAEKYHQAKRKLDTLRSARQTQRKQRLENKIPLVSIIGYTNAGKSSLLNKLTKSDVLAENKLFATLDTTTREFYIGQGKKCLISDTVGFISNLPHNLVEAFQSTLDELRYSNLLLHVVDLSNPSWDHQIAVVNKTLQDLEVVDKPILYVFNKIDKISEEELVALKERVAELTPSVFVSTLNKEDVASLIAFIKGYTF